MFCIEIVLTPQAVQQVPDILTLEFAVGMLVTLASSHLIPAKFPTKHPCNDPAQQVNLI
jgi:hypothetical protein